MNLGQSWVDFSPLAKKRLRKTNLFYADIFSNFDLENLYSNDCRNDKTERDCEKKSVNKILL